MKVNPVGIQTYQQLNRRDNQGAEQIGQEPAKVADKKVAISPQDDNASSRLAVKTKGGDYSQYLSPEEKNALDILFARYRENGRFGSTYQADSEKNGNGKSLGRIVDVKV